MHHIEFPGAPHSLQDTASSLRIFAPIDAVMQLLSVELQLGPEMEMPRPQVTELPHVYGNSEGATLASFYKMCFNYEKRIKSLENRPLNHCSDHFFVFSMGWVPIESVEKY